MLHWNFKRSQYLTKLIIKEWERSDIVEWKSDKQAIFSQVHHILTEDLNKEKELEKAVQLMLDELEKTRKGEFERYKMYPLLKKELAKKRGIIL